MILSMNIQESTNPAHGKMVDSDLITGWGCQQERCKFEESPRYLQETVMTAIPNNLAPFSRMKRPKVIFFGIIADC